MLKAQSERIVTNLVEVIKRHGIENEMLSLIDFFILCVALPNVKVESDKYSAWKLDILPIVANIFKNTEYQMNVKLAA